MLAVWALLGSRFADPPVKFVATLPGHAGVVTAFIAEALISFGLMLVVLITSGHARWARFTGVVAGTLVALYIWLEGPVSGMSMNPARTLASALPGGLWQSLWIYLTAPCLGMWLAARHLSRVGARARSSRRVAPNCAIRAMCRAFIAATNRERSSA